MHENNLLTKINANYNNLSKEIDSFYKDTYSVFRNRILEIEFTADSTKPFLQLANLLNEYYEKLEVFSKVNKITSQSKLVSSFYEEISSYLFSSLPEIVSGKYGIFNKKIYAGIKINTDDTISSITKDVDFCIGKQITISISNQTPITIIVPIVAVEVKTYLDATMFGEIKSSSSNIRSATPNSKTYVLIGHKELDDRHIISARHDSFLSEIYVLREDENSPIDGHTLFLYYVDILNDIKNITKSHTIKTPGRILFPQN